MTQLVDEQRAMVFREAYNLAMTELLPADCLDKMELASLIAWSALTCNNIRAIARGTGRGRVYVTTMMARARSIIKVLE
jgi:hypothetical protein